jgi:prophage tail gpP-like protein
MPDFYSDFVGTPSQDAVQLVLKSGNQRDEIRIYGGYQVKNNLLTQPSAFSFDVGWGDTALELLKLFNAEDGNTKPYPEFELRVAGTTFQSGIIEAVNVPSGNTTTLHIEGRDWLMPLYKSGILNEVTFSKTTYVEVLQEIVDKVVPGGSAKHQILSNYGADRDLVTKLPKFGRKRKVKSDMSKNQLVAQIETGINAPGGGKIVTQQLLAKIGETWFQWLDKELKLAGLLLWATWGGNYIIGSPTLDQPARYHIIRERGQSRNEVNVTNHGYTNDLKGQHTSVIVYGRHGSGAGGRAKAAAGWVNVLAAQKMGGNFYPLVIEDEYLRNDAQAMWRAKRAVSEELRAGFSLKYTCAGHRMPCIIEGLENEMIVWMPDTIVRVDDYELGIHKDMYVEGVTMNSSPETTTTVDLIPPEYLNFFAERDPAEEAVQQKQQEKVRRGIGVES